MPVPTCSTCPYYASEQNECRRHPPSVFGDVSDGGTVGTYEERLTFTTKESGWPEVRPNDWCGEHPSFSAFLAAKALLSIQKKD